MASDRFAPLHINTADRALLLGLELFYRHARQEQACKCFLLGTLYFEITYSKHASEAALLPSGAMVRSRNRVQHYCKVGNTGLIGLKHTCRGQLGNHLE